MFLGGGELVAEGFNGYVWGVCDLDVIYSALSDGRLSTNGLREKARFAARYTQARDT